MIWTASVINDGFGREIGDQLLQSVAQRLQSAVDGEQVTVARFGSDEFAILIEDPSPMPDLAALAARINTQLAEPVYIEGYGWPCPEIADRVVQRVAQPSRSGSGIARAVPVMLELVRCCGATVIARGLETQDEANWWRSAGAHVGQGAFCAPPGAPDEIAALLGSRRSDSI